jgi:hypothetical protein
MQNINAEEAKNIFLILDLEGPFSFKYESERKVFIEHLVAVSSYEQDYHLLVDPDAKTGLYELELIIQDESGQAAFKQKIPIKVEGTPDLAIIDPQVSNTPLKPGDLFDISFTLENKGTGSAKNVRVEAKLENLPIVPLKDNSEYIEDLAPGKSKKISFPLKVSKNAEIAAYQIPIDITALDDTGLSEITSSETMGIEVLGQAILSPASTTTEPSIVSRNQDFFLLIRVGNSGTGDAEAVSAEVDIQFEGIKKAFLSTIEPDEDAPMIFTLKSAEPGNYDYKLNISYFDDLGPHSVVYDLNLYVGKKEFKIMTMPNIIIAILILIVIFSNVRVFIKERK